MFDVSPTEFFTIALIALIVFGPQRLPEIARKLGGYLGEIRKAATDLRAGLDEEVRQIQDPIAELKTDLTKPVSELKRTVDETASSISKPIEDAVVAADGPGAPAEGVEQTPETGDPADPVDQDDEATVPGGTIEWIGPEPEVGVKPADAWAGLDDPMPDALLEAAPEGEADALAPPEPEGAGETAADEGGSTADELSA